MKKLVLPVLLLLLFFFFSQCTYTLKIKDGQTAYDRKQYDVAIGFFQKEFKKADRRTEKGKIAFLLGESYSKKGNVDQALPWYKTAYDNGFGIEALKQYAYGLKTEERYAEAKDNFQQLGFEIGSPYEYRREVTACDVAAGWIKDLPDNIEIHALPINGKGSEFGAVLLEGRKILFTKDQPSSDPKSTYHWTGRSFMDIFEADLHSNKIQSWPAPINTADHEGCVALSGDYSEIFFTRCSGDVENVSYCKILRSTLENGVWSIPKALDFQKEKVNYIHPSLSRAGDLLYFASNDPDGWGGYDLYVSERIAGGWETPKLLSRNINSTGNEVFPNIDSDTLYFSSDYHTGMGGLDIFRVYKISKTSWSAPQNLKPPVNSGADDFGYVVDYQSPKSENVFQNAYFSSNRKGGVGSDDIYFAEWRVPSQDQVVELPKKEDTLAHRLLLEGYVLEKIFADRNDPNSPILGRKPVAEALVEVNFGNENRTFTTAEDGFFSLELLENQDYRFTGSKVNYLTREERFTTKGIGKDPSNPVQVFELEIVLDRIFKNKEIVLENIYYDYDKWDIRTDAKPTLDRLAADISLNLGIKIQLASHTDCRGNDSYNLDLSQKRAQSAVDYLISKGISPDRLSAKGFGESIPAVDCFCTRCTEEEHQANRRTTFTILD